MQRGYPVSYYHIYWWWAGIRGTVEKKLIERLENHKALRITAGSEKLLLQKNFINKCRQIGTKQGWIEFIFFNDELSCKSNEKIEVTIDELENILTKEMELKRNPPTSEDYGELKEIVNEITKLVNGGILRLKMAPGTPLVHFIILDDDEIFLQSRHRKNWPKRHLHVVNYPEYIKGFIEKFDFWLEQCVPITIN